jgi:DNA-binding XRE family transcriptional regulator
MIVAGNSLFKDKMIALIHAVKLEESRSAYANPRREKENGAPEGRADMAVDLRERYFTTGQAAEFLGVRRQAVYQMLENGRLVPQIITPIGRLFVRAELLRVKRLRDARAAKRRPVRTPLP